MANSMFILCKWTIYKLLKEYYTYLEHIGGTTLDALYVNITLGASGALNSLDSLDTLDALNVLKSLDANKTYA